MNAAIKCIEDTLLIRRLQAREFQGDGAACERLAVPPGRLLGRMIRAAFEPAAGDPAPVALEDLLNRSEEA